MKMASQNIDKYEEKTGTESTFRWPHMWKDRRREYAVHKKSYCMAQKQLKRAKLSSIFESRPKK